MTDTRERRLRALADLIRAEPMSSQEELTERLRSLGHQLTQATVSRDLEQLGAVKVKRDGTLRYVLPDQIAARDWSGVNLERIVRDWVLEVEPAGPLVVLRTPPGTAHLVAATIDQAQMFEIAGTVAGDDTIFLAIRDGNPIADVLRRFEGLMGRGRTENIV
ncbi:MAG: argR [Alphaproteobacteria bacterium]|nr:argR [Alphaproteobacteria bacterium]